MLHPQWSLKWNAPPRGLRLARETGHLLLWDEHQWLTILNRSGERQAQHHRPQRIIGAGIAEDASTVLVADAENHLVLLGHDLKPLWERRLSQKINAIAVDPLGEHFAVAETTGRIRLIDRLGQLVRDFQCPRPAHHLVFEPTTTRLDVAADFGFVGSLDLRSGEWIWRDTPVSHLGSLAVTGTGDRVFVACFTDGARIYDSQGKLVTLGHKIPPCRMVRIAIDAGLIVTLGLRQELVVFSADGKPRFEQPSEHPWLAIAVGGLGDQVFAASAEPRLFRWSLVE